MQIQKYRYPASVQIVEGNSTVPDTEDTSLYSENLGDDPTNNDSNKSTTLTNDNISGFEFISKTVHHGWSDPVRVTYTC